MKLKEITFANALAAFTAILFIVCRLGIALFPDFSKLLVVSWFHGFDVEALWSPAFQGSMVLGFVSAAVGGWLSGWVFAKIYNKMLK